MIPLKKSKNQNRIDFLRDLRDSEFEALEKLDVARVTGDPVKQEEALSGLRRIMIDFIFDTYLIYNGNGNYKIDYSYFDEWKKGKMKSIHSELKREENKAPIIISGVLR